MNEKKEFRFVHFNAVLTLAAFLVTLLLVLGGSYVRDGYNLQIGSVSQQRIKAPRKVENIVATQRNRQVAEEAAAMMDPVTERDSDANTRMIGYVNDFFEVVEDYRESNRDKMNQATEAGEQPETSVAATQPAETERSSAQGTGIRTALVPPKTVSTPEPHVTLPINLRDTQVDLLLNMSSAELTGFREHTLIALADILEDGIQQIDQKSLSNAKDTIDMLEIVSDEKTLANDIIRKYLEPNVIINGEATQKARDERSSRYETVYYLQDQTIVDEGQIVTEEAYAVLESLGLVQSGYIDNIWLIIGTAMVVFAVFGLTMVYIYSFYRKTLPHKKELLLLYTLYVLVISVTWFIDSAPYPFVPILVFTMLVALMFDARMSIVLNFGVTLVCFMIYKGNLEFLTFFFLSGIFVSLISKFATERNKLIIVGLLICAVNVFIYVGVTLFFEKKYTDALLIGTVYAFLSGILVVIISIGTTPFWEGVFGVVTAYRLQDLTNPNNLLMRRLTIEAPGTYHHSLIVANLAETAAFEIGANPSLARVGGYYHDIGKLKYPQYFAENQVATNLHDTMDPYSSVQLIVSHVSFGLELADKNNLPPIIKDIIAQHHGNGIIKYFYYKAQKAAEEAAKEAEKAEGKESEKVSEKEARKENGKENGKESKKENGKEAGKKVGSEDSGKKTASKDTVKKIDEADFRYNYPIPQSKEAAVVMLADTVEAAVRSMIPTGKSMPEVEKFVRTLIQDKLEEGQLNDSMLTIKDIETIIICFMRVFKGMYHERISYPKIEKRAEKFGEAVE